MSKNFMFLIIGFWNIKRVSGSTVVGFSNGIFPGTMSVYAARFQNSIKYAGQISPGPRYPEDGMRIEFNTKMSHAIHKRASSQFRFIRLQTAAGPAGNINRPSEDPIGKTKDPNFRFGLSGNSPYLKNINQAISRLNFLDRMLAEAAYRGALASAARMIQAAPIDTQR